ncbi:MAG TPA: hypothetical protein VHY37_09340 [Tepidisphaeraceae bacterium]|jgi:hypothetical protein|nr:hypothetical protein [Tepidisphaeraceae bacterium]
MVALKDLVRSALPHHEQEHTVAKRSAGIGGIVLLVLVGLGIYWILPEIRRYIRIERM